jgi:hypothetical protein
MVLRETKRDCLEKNGFAKKFEPVVRKIMALVYGDPILFIF